MQRNSFFFRLSRAGVLVAGVLSAGVPVWAQTKPTTIPDAQIEANVLKALAGEPKLADQSIVSTTAFGTVTLSGTVSNEDSRSLADKVVSSTAGVQKVVDQLTIGTSSTAVGSNETVADSQATGGSNPNLQSDGTMAPPAKRAPSASAPQSPGVPQQPGQYAPYGGQPQEGPYPRYGQYPSTNGPPQSGQYPPTNGYSYPQQPYSPKSEQPGRPFVAQKGGDAVVVPAGSMVRVRINQGMDSKHTTVGTMFDGVVLNDVIGGGSIAIPRGAAVRGTVVEAHKAGDFKGKGELKLQLTQLQLGGAVYPIVSDFWWHQGADKTANTVGNSVGLGAMGALIGAVAGGGAGALVGAGIGSVAGLGVSASQRRGEAGLPPEAIVTFHLTQPADITTVSQAELNRLGAGVPTGGGPQMQRRYPPPPPPGYYPGYYSPPY